MWQQLSCKGNPDGVVSHVQPFVGSAVFDFHAYGIDGYHKDKQHQHAWGKSIAQVYGVVQPGIVQRVSVDDNRLQKCHGLLFRSSLGI